MLKRTISGAVYVAIIVGFFLLRQFVDYRLFIMLPWIFSIIGSIEMANALKDKTDRSEYLLSIFAGITTIPVYACFSFLLDLTRYALTIALTYVLVLIIICVLFAIIRNRTGMNGEVKEVDFRAFFYPTVLLLFLADCNSFMAGKGFISLLLIFAISPFTDTAAYLVGLAYNAIRKGNAKKLCPKLSPKKTVAGAIGGLIGGVLGAILVAIIFEKNIRFFGISNPLLIFALIGLGGAIFTQAGDLFESHVKRQLGIKDMGNIMPGHGGIMDRIDGVLFNSAYIFIVFMFI